MYMTLVMLGFALVLPTSDWYNILDFEEEIEALQDLSAEVSDILDLMRLRTLDRFK